jgi:hypothetical protein
MPIVLDINKLIVYFVGSGILYKQSKLSGRPSVEILDRSGFIITEFSLTNNIDIISLKPKLEKINKYYNNILNITYIISNCNFTG